MSKVTTEWIHDAQLCELYNDDVIILSSGINRYHVTGRRCSENKPARLGPHATRVFTCGPLATCQSARRHTLAAIARSDNGFLYSNESYSTYALDSVADCKWLQSLIYFNVLRYDVSKVRTVMAADNSNTGRRCPRTGELICGGRGRDTAINDHIVFVGQIALLFLNDCILYHCSVVRLLSICTNKIVWFVIWNEGKLVTH